MRTVILAALSVVLSTSPARTGETTAPDLYAAPAKLPPNTPTLSAVATPETTRESWPQQREALRQLWQKELGSWPTQKAPLNAKTLGSETLDGFTRVHIQYQLEEGVWTDGYLLEPEPAGTLKLPAVVVFHPTTTLQAKGVAGVAPEYTEEKQMGVQLVKRGYMVWCPRNYLFDDIDTGLKGGAHYTELTKRIHQKHPDWSGLMRMLWEGVRSADFLESLPRVDSARIGCTGHSLGAKVTLFAAAFDTRYKAAVFSEGGIGLKMSNWHDIWYLDKKIQAPTFALDNHQVIALIAPRAFLLLGGDSADNDMCWAYIQAARPAYKLFDAEKNLAWWNHRLGHNYPPAARTVAEEFLDKHLKR